MSVTYYTELEYIELKNKYFDEKHLLMRELKKARGEQCNMIDNFRRNCMDCIFYCGEDHDIRCESKRKYLPK
jgi:hypothetical protein